jgi:hypothetical protein
VFAAGSVIGVFQSNPCNSQDVNRRPYAIPACSGQALLEIIIKSWLRQRFRTRESAKWTPRPFDATLR